MKEIATFEMKKHLSEILSRVKNGEEFCITKHGHAIATLQPIDKNKISEKAYNDLHDLLVSKPLVASYDELDSLKSEGRE